MRILHSADWQLGLLPQQVEAGPALRDQRFETARGIVRLAHQREVDLIVLAGDTFDSPDVDEMELRQALEIFESAAPTPILLLPGNHDPWQPGSVWSRRAWRNVGDHVSVLHRAEESVHSIAGQAVAIYPCPLSQKKSRLDPTAWIPKRGSDDDRLRLGVAHGSLTTLGVRASFPIEARRAELAGLDYLALGDWHGLQHLPRTAYPGTPEPTGFGEQNPGHVLIVDLEPGSMPVLDAVPVARFWWRTIDRALSDETDLAQLRAEVLESDSLECGILRVRLDIKPSLHVDSAEIEDLRNDLGSRLFELDWSVHRSAEFSEGRLPAGLIEEIDHLLDACSKDEAGVAGSPFAQLLESYDRRLDPQVATAARRLLHRLAESET